jgi:hypothetical protein
MEIVYILTHLTMTGCACCIAVVSIRLALASWSVRFRKHTEISRPKKWDLRMVNSNFVEIIDI